MSSDIFLFSIRGVIFCKWMQNSIIVYCRDVEGKHGYNFSEVPWQLDGKGHFRLDGLKKYCKYGLVVQAFNGRGSGPMSPEVVAQTLEDGKLPFSFFLA